MQVLITWFKSTKSLKFDGFSQVETTRPGILAGLSEVLISKELLCEFDLGTDGFTFRNSFDIKF